MRDLTIYGKNTLLELFRAYLKKQIGAKPLAGRPSTWRHISKPNKRPGCVPSTDRNITLNGEPLNP